METPQYPNDPQLENDETESPRVTLFTQFTGKIASVDSPTGKYMVLAADKPTNKRGPRAMYVELGFYEASTPQAAKAKALADNEGWLQAYAEERTILLRAISADKWPAEIPETGIQKQPRFVIG